VKASRRSNKAKGQSSQLERAKGVILELPNLSSIDVLSAEPPSANLQMPAKSEPVVLTGPLDQYGAEALKAQALGLLDGTGDAIFDFRGIDRMHTAALQVLVALHKDLEPSGRHVILQSVDPVVRKLFIISGTEQFFEFLDGSH
jgi:anti-anti-sigma factor